MANTPKYTFLPWLRQGLSSNLDTVDSLGVEAANLETGRAAVTVQVRVNEQQLVDLPAKTVEFYGPGDVMGFERRAVVKTEPLHGVRDFEHNYFPYIEFYEEDFPWRYTPATPASEGASETGNPHRLRPWLALLVFENGEFETFPPVEGLRNLSSLRVPLGADSALFPNPKQTWAWAHVHVNQALAGGLGSQEEALNNLSALLQNNPNAACSRLICPRRLKEDTEYHAFVIPAFEQGRRAGLGAHPTHVREVPAMEPSWGKTHSWDPKNLWPIYYQWQFKTGSGEDFEALVRKIIPRKLDRRVGRMEIDVQKPGWGLRFQGAEAEPTAGAILMSGALKVPVPEEEEENDFLQGTEFVKDLAGLINLEEDLKENSIPENSPFYDNPFFEDEDGDATAMYDDPIVTPPFYAKHYHTGRRVAPDKWSGWPHRLNLDPQHRMVAGMGAQVIQENQENLMDRAWDHLAEVEKVNHRLRRLQLSVELSGRLYTRHLSRFSSARLLAFSAAAHPRIRVDSGSQPQTLQATLQQQAFPAELLSPVYQRLFRPSGAVARRLQAQRRPQVYQMTAPQYNLVFQARTADVFAQGGNMGSSGSYQNQGSQSNKVEFEIDKLLRYLNPISMGWGNPFGGETSTIRAAILEWQQLWGSQLRRVAKPPDGGGRMSTYQIQVFDYLNPIHTLVRATWRRTELSFSGAATPVDEVRPISYQPEFPEATYQPLTRLSPDYFLPNLHLIPPDTFGLLETNRAFIEAYLAGLNHEMGRELYWRGYPVDLTATFFRQFWAVLGQKSEVTKDILPIRQWPENSPLGDLNHSPRAKPGYKPVFFEHTIESNGLVSYTWLSHPEIDGRPDLLLFVSSAFPEYFKHSVRVGFSSGRWYITSYTSAAIIPDGARFFVLAIDPAQSNRAFIHRVDPGNVFGGFVSRINHPLTNNNPSAIILITRRHEGNQTYQNAPIGLNYLPSTRGWQIYREDRNNIRTDAAFNVLVLDPGEPDIWEDTIVQAFEHKLTSSNNGHIMTFFENGRSGGSVFFTNRYRGKYNPLFSQIVNANGLIVTPHGFLGPPDPEGRHYEDGMSFNIATFRKAEGHPRSANRLVFAIRGELLKKFPRTLIYLQKAAWQLGENGLDKTLPRVLNTSLPEYTLQSAFQAQVDPDIHLLGFDISIATAMGNISADNRPGWFVVIRERPGELHFGMDQSAGDAAGWDNLNWEDGSLGQVGNYLDLDLHQPQTLRFTNMEESIGNQVVWGRGEVEGDEPGAGEGNAADMAWILYQKPFMVAIHVEEMLVNEALAE
ncbi:MAG: hypothetical protein H6573_22575 [Lewinellaceae bacterium]|nr:hypothetical protein [Phaeodactylibacter sp.]MCB0612535.1 hypothetical protein [Phaeodactylibacter sp.]MCB9350272.1 hypothetical protein [Lewinellaceae bacterium]